MKLIVKFMAALKHFIAHLSIHFYYEIWLTGQESWAQRAQNYSYKYACMCVCEAYFHFWFAVVIIYLYTYAYVFMRILVTV